MAHVTSVSLIGIHAFPVRITTSVLPGAAAFEVTGYPRDQAAECARVVATALAAAGVTLPPRRIQVSIEPHASLRDLQLPVAVAILVDLGLVPRPQQILVGELGYDGALLTPRGGFPIAQHVRRIGQDLLMHRRAAGEATAVPHLRFYGADTLRQVIEHLTGEEPLRPMAPDPVYGEVIPDGIRGNEHAWRALQIAGAGGHSLLLTGDVAAPTAALARRLPFLLPRMTDREAAETAALFSVAGLPTGGLPVHRPFRAPHFGVSVAGMVGRWGEDGARPGECSLAHNGVLYLDNLHEFSVPLLRWVETLRVHRKVVLVRKAREATLPAAFQLVAATSAPRRSVLRFDLHAHAAVQYEGPVQEVLPARARVAAARQVQFQRQGRLNAALSLSELRGEAGLAGAGTRYLAAVGAPAASILRVARTLADLDGSVLLTEDHVEEAIHFTGDIG